MTTKLCKIR